MWPRSEHKGVHGAAIIYHGENSGEGGNILRTSAGTVSSGAAKGPELFGLRGSGLYWPWLRSASAYSPFGHCTKKRSLKIWISRSFLSYRSIKEIIYRAFWRMVLEYRNLWYLGAFTPLYFKARQAGISRRVHVLWLNAYFVYHFYYLRELKEMRRCRFQMGIILPKNLLNKLVVYNRSYLLVLGFF